MKYYIVFCVLLLVFFIITYFLFPETKGYSLEEITRIFDGNDALDEAAVKTMDKKIADETVEPVSHHERV